VIDNETRHLIGKARLLRRQGKTYNEIRDALGPIEDDTLRPWMNGIPRPRATYRAAPLTELRRECRRLRGQGLTQEEIAEITGASVGSLSLWLRDIPLSAVAPRERVIERFQKTCAKSRERRMAAREAFVESKAEGLPSVDERALLFIGLAIY
jgi:transcriptional regulator with XRE-family HTH domain